ncbi:hypothetical protein [Streptomyces sp. NBC_00273]|uniref:hypothetical protein n=1 Tax=Streptomyces sp. NBC_00273 TaxID=2903644 RepID=UPI002E2B7F41|nr:hypothetical protein [Streptomyces sp. NBC_00273]
MFGGKLPQGEDPWDEAEVKALIEAMKGDRLFGVMLLTLIAGATRRGVQDSLGGGGR